MSPRIADPDVREALVEAAARLLAQDGPAALSTRRVAAAVGTSTMAVYTHFGGKDDLVRAIAWEGFARLARHLGSVRSTPDPVADVAQLGLAYRANALANPHLYGVMFGDSPVPEYAPTPEDMTHSLNTFVTLVDAVQRCIDAGRWDDGGAPDMAAQLWASLHGVVTLELNGFLSSAEALGLSLTTNLAVGFGDHPDRARASVAKAGRRRRPAPV